MTLDELIWILENIPIDILYIILNYLTIRNNILIDVQSHTIFIKDVDNEFSLSYCDFMRLSYPTEIKNLILIGSKHVFPPYRRNSNRNISDMIRSSILFNSLLIFKNIKVELTQKSNKIIMNVYIDMFGENCHVKLYCLLKTNSTNSFYYCYEDQNGVFYLEYLKFCTKNNNCYMFSRDSTNKILESYIQDFNINNPKYRIIYNGYHYVTVLG